MKRLLLILLVILGIAGSNFAQKPTDKRLVGLDTMVNRLLKEWHAAGVGIAVVEKNKVVYAGGFGFADYENKRPVTANTLFAIGSCTKAFTATLIGKLQADGKLSYDEKVTTYLPDFKFYNDELTDHVTIRDLTCHRTGLPRHDLSWYLNPTTRDSLIQRIQYMEPSAGLRERWQYNNFMFLLQGVIAEKLNGKPWETLIQEQIFQPLNMKTSNFTAWDGKYNDVSKGYRANAKDAIKFMEYYRIDGMGPAGSIFSSPTEMANWVTAWINGGKFNGTQVIPEAHVREAMSSQMVIGAGLPTKENPDSYLSNYGMGWFLASYRGHYRVEHGGNINGFSASTSFFPSDSIGIVVLVNQNGSVLPGMIRNYISDKMLKLPYRNWHQQIKEAMDKAKAAEEQAKAAASDSLSRKPGTHPSHALAAYTGSFENPGYGTLQVTLKHDTLFLIGAYHEADSWLEHYHYDVFVPNDVMIDPDDEQQASSVRLQFLTDLQGDINAFTIKGLEAGVEDIKFTRKIMPVAVATNELEKYVGDYALPGVTAKVYLRGETLMVLVPGQPDYETIPLGNHEFKLKVPNVDGFSVRFEMSGDKVTAMYFVQPNGTFKATKK